MTVDNNIILKLHPYLRFYPKKMKTSCNGDKACDRYFKWDE